MRNLEHISSNLKENDRMNQRRTLSVWPLELLDRTGEKYACLGEPELSIRNQKLKFKKCHISQIYPQS